MFIGKSETVNVWNEFYPEKLNELTERLESGKVVHIYVDCIGHSRAERVERQYLTKLQEKYGDSLIADKDDWSFNVYYLKGGEN